MDSNCIRKVKLKLIQPDIMCSGRDRVEANYRGSIIHDEGNTVVIEFKYQGDIIHAAYDLDKGFQLLHLQDIKIVE